MFEKLSIAEYLGYLFLKLLEINIFRRLAIEVVEIQSAD